MSKQTRRSVSISGELYAKLKERAQAEDSSQSAIVEQAMRHFLGMAPRKSRKPDAEKMKSIDEVVAKHVSVSPKVEVVRTTTSASVRPKAKPKINGTKRATPKPAPEPTYGMTEEQREARKAKLKEAHRRAGNIFTF